MAEMAAAIKFVCVMCYSASAVSIGALLARKYIYFVPFGQDDPEHKPTSLIANFDLVVPAAQAALEGRQLQPLLLRQ